MRFIGPAAGLADATVPIEERTGAGSLAIDTTDVLALYVKPATISKAQTTDTVFWAVETSVDGATWSTSTADFGGGSGPSDIPPDGGNWGGGIMACPGPYTRLLWFVEDNGETGTEGTATIGAEVYFGYFDEAYVAPDPDAPLS